VRGFFLFGFGETRDAVFGGTIGDILVKCGGSLGTAEEEVAVILGDGEWRVGKKENVAGFELGTKLAAAGGGVH